MSAPAARTPAAAPTPTPRRVIGWYVHHVGQGHARRAEGLARSLRARLDVDVVGLSTLPRPAGWEGGWLQLPPDEVEEPSDPTAGGHLHWAPRHPRIRERAGAISQWLVEAAPAAFVSDVSIEAALLARLHGVPVVAVALPGERDDAAHALGFGVADAVVGFWPASATDELLHLRPALRRRVAAVGASSSFPGRASPGQPLDRHVVALSGRGGAAWSAEQLARVRQATEAAGWTWTVLGEGSWVEDPSDALRRASVVITHAGQNALADVAAARRPAVVVPAVRPHAEQRSTGAALARGDWPVRVLDDLAQVPAADWPDLLAGVARLGGGGWGRWCDGRADERFIEVVAAVLEAS